MKRLTVIFLVIVMIISTSIISVQAASWKKYISPVDQNGTVYKNGDTILLPENEKIFLFFDTDFSHNEEHGVSVITGFSDGYDEGTLTTKGFKTNIGYAKDLGYKGDFYGLEVGKGKVAVGTKGELQYFLYKHPYVERDDGGIDFVKTPHVLDQKVYIQVVPKTMKVKTLEAAKKAITVKWNKQKGVNGYQVQYSLKKSFKSDTKTRTVKSAKTVSLKLTKLEVKKKYYVRIRSYKTVKGKKVYSKWSPAKTATTKK